MIGALVGGKYRIEQHLGAGGMGTVWVAVQEPLGRRVALKVIAGSNLDPATRARFEREAKIVAGLRCPHVVTLHDFGEHEGAPYIVLELLDGETLRERLSRGPLGLDAALALVRDVACGLRSAHEMGIVHGDLKPENVVIVADRDRGERAKLLDFGIARSVASDGAHEARGGVAGTPGYIAPEVVRGGSDDPRVDLYALGVVLFEMLVGEPPFAAESALGLFAAHAREPRPDPRRSRPEVPRALAELVVRLMALDPEERPRNGDALVLELDRLRVAHAPTSFLDGPDGSVPSSALGLPDRPSLAVQPFRAGGGTDDDALFAEGVSEDILTALSRFKQLFVISQTSMLGSVARDSDVLRVGCVLGVRYVVQGNVRRGGGRLRISAKLVDAQTGEQVWDHRYDREPSDLFALQDEITRHVVASVAAHVEVAHGERARKSPPHALLAYDWLARGRAYHHRRTLEDNQRSRECLDRAVEIDPECAQAHAWRACAYGQALMMGVPLGESAATSLMHSLHRALALDDTDAECQRMACELAFDDGDLVKAEYHHARAIALNPNDARIVAQAGELATYSGDLDEARDHLLLAARLDPLSPKSYLRLLARVQYLRGDLDDAWRLLHCLGATQPAMLALRAAVAALRGDLDDARALRERVIAAAPDWSPSASVLPFADPARRATWLAGFEAADRAAASALSAPPAPRPASRGRRS